MKKTSDLKKILAINEIFIEFISSNNEMKFNPVHYFNCILVTKFYIHIHPIKIINHIFYARKLWEYSPQEQNPSQKIP